MHAISSIFNLCMLAILFSKTFRLRYSCFLWTVGEPRWCDGNSKNPIFSKMIYNGDVGERTCATNKLWPRFRVGRVESRGVGHEKAVTLLFNCYYSLIMLEGLLLLSLQTAHLFSNIPIPSTMLQVWHFYLKNEAMYDGKIGKNITTHSKKKHNITVRVLRSSLFLSLSQQIIVQIVSNSNCWSFCVCVCPGFFFWQWTS